MPTESPPSPITVAVIDVGTNTALLLLAEVTLQGSITPIVYEQRIPRLGRGVDASRRLHPASMERVIQVLEEYRDIVTRYAPRSTVVIGTSAVRDAENKLEFAEMVLYRTGFILEVLAGEEEAYWTYRGAISGLTNIEHATVVDIGGGSTEITSGTRDAVNGSISMNIGSVRLTERLLRHDPPTGQELDALRSAIRESLGSVQPKPDPNSRFVGVAGTATTLALLSQGRREFSLEAVSGAVLTLAQVSFLADELGRMTVSDILRRGSYLSGRADVITAGAWILKEVMLAFGFRDVVVSERGVRYGIALREAERGRSNCHLSTDN